MTHGLTDVCVIAIRDNSLWWCKAEDGRLEKLSELWVDSQPYEITSAIVDHFNFLSSSEGNSISCYCREDADIGHSSFSGPRKHSLTSVPTPTIQSLS